MAVCSGGNEMSNRKRQLTNQSRSGFLGGREAFSRSRASESGSIREDPSVIDRPGEITWKQLVARTGQGHWETRFAFFTGESFRHSHREPRWMGKGVGDFLVMGRAHVSVSQRLTQMLQCQIHLGSNRRSSLVRVTGHDGRHSCTPIGKVEAHYSPSLVSFLVEILLYTLSSCPPSRPVKCQSFTSPFAIACVM